MSVIVIVVMQLDVTDVLAKLTDWKKGQRGGGHGAFLYYLLLYHKEATKALIPDAVKQLQQQLTVLSLNHFVCLLEYNFSDIIA